MINLYVYTGDFEHRGVCPFNVSIITSFVEIDSRINYNTVNNQKLNNLLSYLDLEQKEKNTILVFPGGTPSLWDHQLNETKNKIITYIENGGRALMICAGAYFSASVTTFNGIRKMHGLNFFPGIACGPLESLDIPSNQVRAVEVTDAFGKKGFLYLNQGGYFIPDENLNEKKDFKTLLKYNDNRIAAAQRNIGKGTVVMTFPHIEYSESHLDFSDQSLEIQESIKTIHEKLLISEDFRMNFIKTIFKELFPKE